MRRCQAGIIAVTVDESRKDDEDERVVLLWDKRLDVPSNLQLARDLSGVLLVPNLAPQSASLESRAVVGSL